MGMNLTTYRMLCFPNRAILRERMVIMKKPGMPRESLRIFVTTSFWCLRYMTMILT